MELTIKERNTLSKVYDESQIDFINHFMISRNISEHSDIFNYISSHPTETKTIIQEYENQPLAFYKLYNKYSLSKSKINDESTHLGTYEQVNHPQHYNKYDIETIDMMIKLWGMEQTAIWCKLTAFKYRMRIGLKPDNPPQQDIDKESWYLNMYHNLIYLNSQLNNNPN